MKPLELLSETAPERTTGIPYRETGQTPDARRPDLEKA
jgi:hypothetical protein